MSAERYERIFDVVKRLSNEDIFPKNLEDVSDRTVRIFYSGLFNSFQKLQHTPSTQPQGAKSIEDKVRAALRPYGVKLSEMLLEGQSKRTEIEERRQFVLARELVGKVYFNTMLDLNTLHAKLKEVKNVLSTLHVIPKDIVSFAKETASLFADPHTIFNKDSFFQVD